MAQSHARYAACVIAENSAASAREDGFSVIICAYTFARWDELIACVESVAGQTRQPLEIILVIDGNHELKARAEATFNGVKVVMNDGVRGLSGGRMTGSKLARGRYLAFLDDDAVASPGWLDGHHHAYADPNVLGVGGPTRPLWQSPRPAWFPDEFLWVVGCSYRGLPMDGNRIRNPIGANMSVRAEVAERVGSWAEALGRGNGAAGTADETEFAVRAARSVEGGYWAFSDEAAVLHTVTPVRARWAYFVGRCRLEAGAKAVVATLVGTQDGLASERTYVVRSLPVGVLRGLRDAVRGDHGGLLRAGAIVAGLGITAAEYGRLRLGAKVRARLAGR